MPAIQRRLLRPPLWLLRVQAGGSRPAPPAWRLPLPGPSPRTHAPHRIGAPPLPPARTTPEVIDPEPVGGAGSGPPEQAGTEEEGVMSVGAQAQRGWSVEGWVGFWGSPSAEVALRRIPTVVTPDVTAVWPRIPERV